MTKILPDPVGTEESASSPLLFIQNFEVILKSEPVNLTTEMSAAVLPGPTEESSDGKFSVIIPASASLTPSTLSSEAECELHEVWRRRRRRRASGSSA